MRQVRLALLVVLIPLGMIVGGASAAAAATVPAHGSAIAQNGNGPLAEPTGCPSSPGELCSYIYQGAGQGAGDICFYRPNAVDNWGSLESPGGLNCNENTGALVNTHTSGDVAWYQGKDQTEQESCIGAGSYYADLGQNQYPNGAYLLDDIDSSYQEPTGSC